jgi:uncharacterized phage-associated protein
MESEGIAMGFDEAKTTEAAAIFIKHAGGKMSYMGLLKFLYVADRLSLSRRGRPITGDEYFAMQFGPVLSRTKDLILDRAYPPSDGVWEKAIERDGQWDVKLTSDPGSDSLSDAEEKIIEKVASDFARYAHDKFGFAKHLHDHFPEVEEVEPRGRKPLPLDRVLAGNKNSEQVDAQMLAELTEKDDIEAFFQAAEMAKHG